ncbi:hypothetical protein BCR41DRAFT_372690 [Lobosporangium transversale]|uniref:RING-type domain-containing protein n=1 Tax=Lobosporangium transversale TaxID=64571 RepID=A0A1Y2GH30_9FUNG|nr:hypothetical protein BCR41DRAFT_372690 [Lobosporangium transversale]ORZ09656.1 hypothetical protein BCR41DRAFT_372690 [Lobosporangium transversale]|eukprot:XP_021878926.1 hypothetical protein BCR41DRAFT_372690 [Lobosporangium transversale]
MDAADEKRLSRITFQGNNNINYDEEHKQHQKENKEKEILPDNIYEILRRMQEEFKCPIWCDAFHTLNHLLSKNTIPCLDSTNLLCIVSSFAAIGSLGTIEQPMSTGCNHTFCRECILRALDRKDGCPLCNTHITKRSLNKVEHLERLIESFMQLKAAFEHEDGFCNFDILFSLNGFATKN